MRVTRNKIGFTCSQMLNPKNPSATTLTHTHIMFYIRYTTFNLPHAFVLYIKGVSKNLQKTLTLIPNHSSDSDEHVYIPPLHYEHVIVPDDNDFYLCLRSCHLIPQSRTVILLLYASTELPDRPQVSHSFTLLQLCMSV